jgi:MFS family permease
MTLLCGLAPTFFMLLLARAGTAVGEAGGSPPSHSLISDYFTAARRGTAMSVFALGAPAGAVLSGLLGGIGNEMFGWRATLVLAGIPGLLLAPLVLFTVTEPRSIVTAGVPKAGSPVFTLREVAAFLWQRRSFRHLCCATALHSLVIYGTTIFNAPFLARSHQWNSTDIGKLVALTGVVGMFGTFAGGLLADRCSARRSDQRWYLWVCGLATLLMAPFEWIAYLGLQPPTVVIALSLCGLLGMAFFGPVFATTQALAPPGMRAVAAAVLIFVQTMIGLGLGPLLVGGISDMLQPVVGAQSLRYALLVPAVFNCWAAVHFFLGARYLRDDLVAHQH